MRTERCFELFADKELQAFLRAECHRHSRREELQQEFFAAAWVAISECEDEDCDTDRLQRLAHNAIVKQYRRELRERKLIHELLQTYEAEGADPRLSAPSERRKDAGIVLQPRRNWRGDD
jgi:DNA-directed RNA polymerase specialized sigma24 family protein